MTIDYLPLKRITAMHAQEIHQAVSRVVDSGWYLRGEAVERFERHYARYIGTDYCVGVGNGLDALTLMLRAYIELGRLKEGDEVVVPANTYIATILAVTENRLVPVLVDPRMDTFELDDSLVEQALTPRTKAIMLVHLYGRCAYTPRIADLCRRHGLLLFEDNAQAHGCRCEAFPYERLTGSLGHAAAHSFYPGKNLGALGDGGAVTTDDAEVAGLVRQLANYGSARKYVFDYQGRNSRLDEIQAAVLDVKLKYLDADNARRQEIATYYLKKVDNPLVTLPTPSSSVYHIFPLLSPHRDQLQQYLADGGVQTVIHYPIPPHHQRCYVRWNALSLPVTESVHQQELSLPCHPAMTHAEAERVASLLNAFNVMRKTLMLVLLFVVTLSGLAQNYRPEAEAFVCENGTNRFTRALYGGWTDYRIETSDRPVFAIVKKNHHRHLRLVVNGVALDSTDYCRAAYVDGMRSYQLTDRRWGPRQTLEVQVVASHDREGAVWRFRDTGFDVPVSFEARMCEIANPKLHRNGDIGADKPGVFEAAPHEKGLQRLVWQSAGTAGRPSGSCRETFLVIDSINHFADLSTDEARLRFEQSYDFGRQLSSEVSFTTPDPYLNTLAKALVFAADGDWDGQTWLHGCVGWRMPLAGWRAAYVGDVLGWGDRQRSHFDAYARSQVTGVEPTIPHPSQDAKMNMARAEKRWGTQMYSNGYICRNPDRNDQMHHYDMNLNYMDELLWHFQYDADTVYMRKMWPVIKSHLAWEKRNYDPDGDHLYDAYCCIWASDALYYSGGAVTHSSAYNYRGNKLAVRIAELLGEDPQPYRQEAEAILQAMDAKLWMNGPGVWAEYQDCMGLKRLHESPAVWSIYTPIDCGACSPAQAWQATGWIDRNIPHIPVADTGLSTIATSNWLPYSWSINNVAAAEVWHTALAFFESGRCQQGYELLKANVMDQMYYGQCPGNFGQISHYDAARGECYRDFGDCIGIASRTLVQGLFGVVPQALFGRCMLRPGFPVEWDSVAVKTPYLSYTFTRRDGMERYEITQHFRQPLQIVLRQNCGGGQFRDIAGTSEEHQVIEVPAVSMVQPLETVCQVAAPRCWGLEEVKVTAKARPQQIDRHFNAEVDDIFKNQYLSPRPQTTTLQIPVQGIGEWCHPQQTAQINDSVFRTLVTADKVVLADIPFHTPKQGRNIVYTSLWDNYPDEVVIPLKGKASVAHLLLAGSTNHMQCRIDNGLVIATYADGTTDTLALRNPENWCPIEQDFYVDGKAFRTAEPRPWRVCLGQASADGRPLVSRDLGRELNITEVYGREIPGGAAQILSMPLNPEKKLRSLTLVTLSNDVVIGLMAVTLQ